MRSTAELFLSVLLISCQHPATPTPEPFPPPQPAETAVSELALATIDLFPETLNLFEIKLPEGVSPGIDIDFNSKDGGGRKHYDSVTWLAQGYDGVKFVGAGRDLTHIQFAPGGYHDSTVFVGPHNGVVAFEHLTIHGAQRKALHMGLATQERLADGTLRKVGQVFAKFRCKLTDVDIVADAPPATLDGPRNSTVWGTFGYQCDWDLRDITYRYAYSAEHAHYDHGYAAKGYQAINVRVEGCGAEGSKHTCRPAEVQYVPGCLLHLQHCYFQNWDQPWSWRGGAGFTSQGSGADILIEDCTFLGSLRTPERGSTQRCLMIDDGGSDYYDTDGVPQGPGPANGRVVIRRCGLKSGGDADYDESLRVGSLRGSWLPNAKVVKSVTIEDCGLYGFHTLAQLSGVAGAISIRRCNTPALKAFALTQGFDVRNETQIAVYGTGLRVFSSGYP